MKWLRLLFLLLVIEIALAAIIGFLTLNTNPCSNYDGWQWTYVLRPQIDNVTVCPSNIPAGYQSSKLRFQALEGVLITIPITAIIGVTYIAISTKKSKPKQHSEA